MKKNVLVLLFIIWVTASNAQKHDAFWFLGYNVCGGCPDPILNFINGYLDTGAVYTSAMFSRTNSSICDANGNLKFYTNGVFIFGNNHQPLPGSSAFNHAGGIFTSTNPNHAFMANCALILPVPSDPAKYIVFHIEGEILGVSYNYQPTKLYYSLIDESLNNGVGGLSIVNQEVLYDTLSYGTLSAVKHANGRDYWVVIHKHNSNKFYSVLLSENASFPQVISSSTGPSYSFGIMSDNSFSADGNHYAIVRPDSTVCFLYSFDRCSGQFTFREQIHKSNLGIIQNFSGISFSHHGKYMYLSANPLLYQFCLDSASVLSSAQQVAVWQGVGTLFGYMSLMPDKRIYISTDNSSSAAVIQNPDSGGLNCNVIQNFMSIYGYHRYLPDFPNFRLGALAGSVCDTLLGTNQISPDFSFQWNYDKHFNMLSFHLPCRNESYQLTVFNMLGQKVEHTTINCINSDDLQFRFHNSMKMGVYLFRLNSNRHSFSGRFLMSR